MQWNLTKMNVYVLQLHKQQFKTSDAFINTRVIWLFN